MAKVNYRGAARITGLPEGTLRRMVCKGAIPYYRLGRRTVRFDADELKEWLARHKFGVDQPESRDGP